MTTRISLHHKKWHPNKPTSHGATAYHNAVIHASWHIDNIYELTKIVGKAIKNGDMVVDFGAGTGSSALYLLKNIKTGFKLWLVDNSPSWLGKSYELLYKEPNVDFFLLKKKGSRYAGLNEVIGQKIANHVLSANTFHLISDLKKTFLGISAALKKGGTFTFQSGNIIRKHREKGVLMIDDTVKEVHKKALDIINSDNKFKKYRTGLTIRIQQESPQRKLVFPNPRPVEEYIKNLKICGFENIRISHKQIKVKYTDWLNFLHVKRLQAGILPEIGGREPTLQEKNDRNDLITMAALKLFKELEHKNPFANHSFFTTEWTYVTADKLK